MPRWLHNSLVVVLFLCIAGAAIGGVFYLNYLIGHPAALWIVELFQ